jgi:Ran GTPase-activating protein (RanGAP) involved in mRNA processing and transport
MFVHVSDEFEASIDTGVLGYMKRCAELSCPPSAKFLKQLKSGATSLKLDHFGLGEAGVMALAECVRVNNYVESLNLEDNSFAAAGAKALTEAFAYNKQLNSINLSRNAIPSKTMLVLLKQFVRGRKVIELSIRQNRLNDTIPEFLATALPAVPITTLDLSHNEITEKGAAHLAKYLESKHALTSLDVSWNNLREAGSKAIADALNNSASRSLQRLSVSWSGSGTLAGQAWAASINSTSLASLRWFDISNNRLDQTAGQAWSAALSTNTSLTHIDLSANPFAAGTDELLAALHNSKSLVSFRISTLGKLVEVDRQNSEAARTRSTFF